jgi:hypothetical protein
VTYLVVQVAYAELDEIPDILLGIGRNKVPQSTVVIFGAVEQMADLQGIPVGDISFAANKATGFVKEVQGRNGGAVGVHISNGQTVDDDHDIDVAAVGGLAPQVAALQADVEQSGAEGLTEQVSQGGDVGWNVDHGKRPPWGEFWVISQLNWNLSN